MIARIIPILRLPPTVSPYFDYLVSEKFEGEVAVGKIVNIPFRGKTKTQGVVVEVKKAMKRKNKKTLKQVISLAYPSLLITQTQIKLSKYLSQLSGVSQALAMKTIAPQVPLKVRGTKGAVQESNSPSPSYSKRGYDSFKPALFHYTSFTERNTFIQGVIKNSHSQVLIVVPEISDIQQLTHHSAQHTTIVHSKLSKSVLFSAWLSILNGATKVIIGTRRALFMPFQNLNAVILDQEHSPSLDNFEQNPHYRAFDVAEFLSKQFKCPLILSSYAPKVSTWERAKYSVYVQAHPPRPTATPPMEGNSLNPLSRGVQGCVTSVVDMNEEMRKENYSPLSEQLKSAILNLTSGNIFLFINKRGHSRAVVCKDCGYVFQCPTCSKPLISHKNAPERAVLAGEVLLCHTCDHREELPPLCPKCNGAQFAFRGKGTQKIAEVLRKEFPGVAVVRMDKDVEKGLNHESPMESRPPTGQARIKNHERILYVGTEFALSRLDWSTIGLVGILDVDSMLVMPDAYATERVYQLIRRIQTYMTYRFDKSDKANNIIIQTHAPSLPIFQSLVQNKPEIFYESEVEIRKEIK